MPTTFADLEARVRGLDSRAQRAEEDITAIITTVTETRDDVRVLKDDVAVLKDDVHELTDQGRRLENDMRELKDDMRWMKGAVQALLDHQGLDAGDE